MNTTFEAQFEAQTDIITPGDVLHTAYGNQLQIGFNCTNLGSSGPMDSRVSLGYWDGSMFWSVTATAVVPMQNFNRYDSLQENHWPLINRGLYCLGAPKGGGAFQYEWDIMIEGGKWLGSGDPAVPPIWWVDHRTILKKWLVVNRAGKQKLIGIKEVGSTKVEMPAGERVRLACVVKNVDPNDDASAAIEFRCGRAIFDKSGMVEMVTHPYVTASGHQSGIAPLGTASILSEEVILADKGWYAIGVKVWGSGDTMHDYIMLPRMIEVV